MRRSPSTADISVPRKCGENLRLLRCYLAGSRTPPQFAPMFAGLEEYDSLLTAYSGKRLREARVLEIGYGARPWRLIALVSMGVDALGVDAEVPLVSGSWREVVAALRRNGLERALKSLLRRALFDRGASAALARELSRRGHQLRIDRSRLLVSDAADLELPQGHFDLIFSEDVFEHISQQSLRALVPKMARWLRPDGLALIRPNIFTGITGGHLLEWSYASLQRRASKRRSAPWEHLRARRFPPNTFLNELRRSEYRQLFSTAFTIAEEQVLFPDLGHEFLRDDVARDLADYPEEELFSNLVMFVLRPNPAATAPDQGGRAGRLAAATGGPE